MDRMRLWEVKDKSHVNSHLIAPEGCGMLFLHFTLIGKCTREGHRVQSSHSVGRLLISSCISLSLIISMSVYPHFRSLQQVFPSAVPEVCTPFHQTPMPSRKTFQGTPGASGTPPNVISRISKTPMLCPEPLSTFLHRPHVPTTGDHPCHHHRLGRACYRDHGCHHHDQVGTGRGSLHSLHHHRRTGCCSLLDTDHVGGC